MIKWIKKRFSHDFVYVEPRYMTFVFECEKCGERRYFGSSTYTIIYPLLAKRITTICKGKK